MRPAGWQRGLALAAAFPVLAVEGSAPCAHQGRRGQSTETFQGPESGRLVGSTFQLLLAVSCFLQATTRSAWLGRCLQGFLSSLHIQVLTIPLFLSLPVLQDMADDIRPAISCLALQTLYISICVQSIPSCRLQQLRDRFRWLWKSRPSLLLGGWLSCWSALES